MAVAILIFLATLFVVIWQPRGLGIGYTASAGAVLALIAGVINISDIPIVWTIVWNATLTFVALIVISLVLNAAGFFKYCALHVGKWGNGNGRILFVLVIVLGAAISSIFANDGTALILTPIVMEMLLALGFSPASSFAFVMATGFIADTTSIPFVVSNLVNIVSADYFHIGFASYARIMVPVDFVAILGSLGVLYLYFRKHIPVRYDTSEIDEPKSAITDRATFVSGWVILVALLAGYFIANPLGVHISFIAGFCAIILLAVAGRHSLIKSKVPLISAITEAPTTAVSNSGSAIIDKPIDVVRIVRDAPWQIVLFSLGMYLVVFGLKNQGLTRYLTDLIIGLSHHGNFALSVGLGYAIAVLASIMNNMPTVLIGALSINAAHLDHATQLTAAYANVIGSDLGPKITPIGSLATLLWLDVLKRKGMTISWGRYFKVGIVLTIPVLATTLTALALVQGG